MTITSVRLQNYRSYSDSSFEFNGGVNIIVGPNASGKTNLLDALYFTSIGRPMKSSKDFIIHDSKSWSRVDVLTHDNEARILKIKTDQAPELHVNNKVYKRLPLSQSIPVVLFEPNHLYFITTSPDMRRQLIDEVLSKTDPEFTPLKNSYNRTLIQRNKLLKNDLFRVKDQIFAWDVRLSELAGRYVEKRRHIIETFNVRASEVYSSIAGKQQKLTLNYVTKNSYKDYASGILKLLQQNLELDHVRGFTGYGPHRDDIGIVLNNEDMRDVASRGETRSVLLSLKVIEAQIVERYFGKKPLLLLDDVFGELDGSRRKSLIDFIASNQTFITTTDADIITHDFVQQANTIFTNK